MKENQNFAQGKLFWPLLRFTAPILAAHFLQTMYGILVPCFQFFQKVKFSIFFRETVMLFIEPMEHIHPFHNSGTAHPTVSGEVADIQ